MKIKKIEIWSADLVNTKPYTIAFKTIDEAIELANTSNYGLASTIWTQDISKANLIANKIESGIVWVNCWLLRDLRTPFGGIKNSGVGREGGWDALKFFTEHKNFLN